MNEQNCTSLELSKKLAEAGCALESLWTWNYGKISKDSTIYEDWYLGFEYMYHRPSEKAYFAHDILNDICVKYAKEFFGKEFIPVDNHLTMVGDPAYIHHPIEILLLMQQGKKQEVELYIWENCLFNPKNKR